MTRSTPPTWRIAAALAAAVAIPSWSQSELIEAPDPSDPMAVHVYRLENGLTVYLSRNDQKPRFHAEIAVRAGSNHDPETSTGIAHYLEHMLFKGTTRLGTLDYESERVHLDSITALYERHFAETDSTRRRNLYALINEQGQLGSRYAVPGELDRIYAALGAEGLNAHTWIEETVYKVDLPANRLLHWARLESERFSQPVFRLFQTELETVYEEKNRSLDNKDRLIREAVNRRLYKVHPYGQQTTLGSVEHLKNPSLELMYEYYSTWYVPNNMAVIISGDIEIGETIALIDSEFSEWEPRRLPKRRKWKEKKLKEVERVEVVYPGEEYVLLAFRTAPSTHRHTEALQVLDYILDNATAGLINLNLNQKQRVRRAGSWTTSHHNSNDVGAQYLYGVPKEGQTLEEVEALLLEQVELIRSGEFEDWIIPAIVTDWKKGYRRRLEENRSRVGLMNEAFLSFQDWDRARRKLERMAKLRRKDIVKAARKYFSGGYVAGYRRDGRQELPGIEKPELDPIDVDPSRQSPFAAGVLALPSAEIEPVFVEPGRDFTRKKLREGVDLYYAANPLNDLFSFEISVDVGKLADARLEAAGRLLDKSGAGDLSAGELKKEWYRLGTGFSFSPGNHSTAISISGLDENFAASIDLMTEILHRAAAPDSTLDELVEIILAERQDAVKDHNTVHRALFRYNRHGSNSSYLRVVPNERLRRLTVEELHSLVASLLSYEHDLSYTGSLPLEEVTETLLQRYPPLTAALKPPPPFQAPGGTPSAGDGDPDFRQGDGPGPGAHRIRRGDLRGKQTPADRPLQRVFLRRHGGHRLPGAQGSQGPGLRDLGLAVPGEPQGGIRPVLGFHRLPGGQDPGSRRGVPRADRRHSGLGGAFRRGAKGAGGAVPHPPARIQGRSGGGAQVGTPGSPCRSEAAALRTDLLLHARTTARLSFGTYRRAAEDDLPSWVIDQKSTSTAWAGTARWLPSASRKFSGIEERVDPGLPPLPFF